MTSESEMSRREFFDILGKRTITVIFGLYLPRVVLAEEPCPNTYSIKTRDGQLNVHMKDDGHLDYLVFEDEGKWGSEFGIDFTLPLFFVREKGMSPERYQRALELISEARDVIVQHNKEIDEDLEGFLELLKGIDPVEEKSKYEDAYKAPPVWYRGRHDLFVESYGGNNLERVQRYMQTVFPDRERIDYAKIFEGVQLICFGETHPENSVKQEVAENIELFRDLGVDCFGFEFISSDFQDFLDSYNPRKDSRRLLDIIKEFMKKSYDPQAYFEVAQKAAESGMRIIALDEGEKYRPDSIGLAIAERNYQMVYSAMRAFEDAEKMVTLTGNGHCIYESDYYSILKIIPKAYPVPTIPTFLKNYHGINVRSVNFIGAIPEDKEDVCIENAVRELAGHEKFMTQVPFSFEGRELSDRERGYDYLIHLPQTEKPRG